MTAFLSYWTFDISLLVLLAVLIIGYLYINRAKASRLFYFSAAVVLCMLCFFSPLHLLAAHYLFSAHMMVHVLLLLCVGPLLVLSLPVNKPVLSSFFTFSKHHAVLCWLTGVGIMWIWHVPFFFNQLMMHAHTNSFHGMHLVEVISLLLAGMLFSAPVIHPNKEFRMDALTGVVYLFTACIGCSLLGLLITFAPTGTYHLFLTPHDAYGLNKLVLHKWGITQAIDQQAAGLIMWVPCCLIYVTGAMYLLMRWFKKEDVTVQLNKA